MAVIEFENVVFSYRQGGRALNGVNLSVEAGEFVCVLGVNGSGKSTLARHANALIVPDEGTVRVAGLDTRDAENTLAVRNTVGLVFQNPDDQIVASIVEDEVAFGPGNLGVPRDELRRRVTRALDRVELSTFGEREVATLSGGQKQLVAIAGALAMQPQALVLDEASSMLDAAGRENLLRVCRELCHAGIAIVYITHLLEEARHADRVVVMREGAIALDGPACEVLAQTDQLAALGIIVPFVRRNAPRKADTSPMQLEFDRVSFAYHDNGQSRERWGLRDMTLHVRTGQIIGIAGPMGSGKSTLLQLAAGLLSPTEGTVKLNGADLAIRQAAVRERRRVGVVFQYPEHQLFASTVFDDVAFGPKNLGTSPDCLEERVRNALQMVGLDFDELRDRSPFSLSGGQQRSVAIAGVLACQPEVLIMDEPTAGLDPRSRASLLELIDRLNAEDGLTVIIASHNENDLATLCDQVVTLNVK